MRNFKKKRRVIVAISRDSVKVKLRSSNRKKLKLSEINELSMAVFIIQREREKELKNRVIELGGKILSISWGTGISRSTVFESLKIGTEDVSVFFVMTRVEDVRDLMKTITEEFALAIPGNGKGFIIDIDGYLGAKAPFIED